jgi:hypothetical protein
MNRRWPLFGIVLVLLAIVLAAQPKPEKKPPEHLLRITLGLKDEKSTDWSGKLEVSGGEIVALEGWRFEATDKVTTNPDRKGGVFTCSTHEYIAPGERTKLATPGEPTPPVKRQPWPLGINITLRGERPAIALIAQKGQLKVQLYELKLGTPKTYIDGQAKVELLPPVRILRPPAPAVVAPAGSVPPAAQYQDDYPCLWIRYKTNRHYLAWVCHEANGKDRVLMVERDGPDGDWSQPIEVAPPGDHFRVALASTHNDDLWVVWSANCDGNWELFGRKVKISESPAVVSPAIQRLTNNPGPDIWHRMTTDNKGRAWLVWQGAREGQFDIFARCADDKGWHEPIQVSTSPANDWDPCICHDTKEDRVWLGWDTYETGDYDIRVRSISDGPATKVGAIEEVRGPWTEKGSEVHVTLACAPNGVLWAAWDEMGQNWGKDTGLFWELDKRFDRLGARLYGSLLVVASRLQNAKWHLEHLTSGAELPQLQPDSEGAIWLAYRTRTCRNPREDGWASQARWDVYAEKLNWSDCEPIPLLASAGRNDMRINSQRDKDGNVFFTCSTDNRTWTPPAMTERNLSIAVSRLSGGPPRPPIDGQGISGAIGRRKPPVHPNEKDQVSRVRSYTIPHQGKTYRIYRGDLHRHTDISGDGVGDGSLMDLHRYALDAAALDFVLVADHNAGNDKEYSWWRTQKANDLYTIPGKFISLYGYERSVRYPNGHRNVIWTTRGQRTLPILNQAIPANLARDTEKLYGYLRDTNGICTAHSSATEQGTDWKDFDGSLEPIVELFQGFQCAYEAPGAPLSIDDKTKIVHQGYRPLGFVQNALDKGYKLGFQASSDHVSTHVSYACVLAEEFSRKGLFDAMKKRHTYAATDNIILDFRAGALGIMGDEVTMNEPALDVNVIGTGDIDRVEVIKNGKVIHSERGRVSAPSANAPSSELKFTWKDPTPEKGRTSYYYVRVIQLNKHMAWASPIWVSVD